MDENYLNALKAGIKDMYQCTAEHTGQSEDVIMLFKGATAFNGTVEIFRVLDHPKAKRCFAWGFNEDEEWQITAVLELPPVDSPTTAVTAAMRKFCEDLSAGEKN